MDICFAGGAEQARLIQSKEVSATEVVQATLDRIESVGSKVNAYSVVLGDQALAMAEAANAAISNGDTRPLLGVPVAIKDTIDVVGQLTSQGTTAVTTPATADSPLVAKLRAAGAVIIGKTTCSELAVWPFTETPAFGATRNPWNTDYSPGGSSGGAGAAVAAGLCGIAVGSDGLGSIRVPAGFNGVFGLKPQRGRVHHGVRDWHGMSVNGPLGRSVADAALFLDVVATTPSPAFREAIATPPRPLRIALAFKSAAYYPVAARLGDEQRQATTQTAELLRSLGHTVAEQEVGFPQSMSTNYMIRYLAGTAENLAAVDQPDQVSKRTRTMASLGQRIPDKVVQKALAGEAKMADKVNQIFDDFDLVLTPGAVEDPLTIGQLDGKDAFRTLYASGRKIPNFAPWNSIGQPAVSIPAGFSSRGLPLAVQLAGPANEEATLLAVAAQLEAARPWADQRPEL